MNWQNRDTLLGKYKNPGLNTDQCNGIIYIDKEEIPVGLLKEGEKKVRWLLFEDRKKSYESDRDIQEFEHNTIYGYVEKNQYFGALNGGPDRLLGDLHGGGLQRVEDIRILHLLSALALISLDY